MDQHLDNFAWACPFCNDAKQQRVNTRIGRGGRYTRLFDPRHDIWEEHFVVVEHGILIRGISPEGRATELVLAFNDNRENGPLLARIWQLVPRLFELMKEGPF